MKLYINDKTIVLIFEDKSEKSLIKKRFTYKDNSNVFAKGSFNAKKIKNVCFVKEKEKYSFLYSGFLQELLLFCKEEK
jgi:hypothetical protein